jgi:hypothetical protein
MQDFGDITHENKLPYPRVTGVKFHTSTLCRGVPDNDNLDQLHTGCYSRSALLPTRTPTLGPTNVDHSYKFVIDTFPVRVVTNG